MTQKPQWLVSRLGSAIKNLDSGSHKLAKSLLNLWNSAGVSGALWKKQTRGDLGIFSRVFHSPRSRQGLMALGKWWRSCRDTVLGDDARPSMEVAGATGDLMLSLPWAVPPNFSPSFTPNRGTCAKVSCRIWSSGVIWLMLLVWESWIFQSHGAALQSRHFVVCLQTPSKSSHWTSLLVLSQTKIPKKSLQGDHKPRFHLHASKLWITRSTSFLPHHRTFLLPCCAWTFWRPFYCPFSPPQKWGH